MVAQPSLGCCWWQQLWPRSWSGSNSNAIPAIQSSVAAAVRPYRFNLLQYEGRAIGDKALDLFRNLGSRLTPAEQQQLVTDYWQQAQAVGTLDDAIDRIYADPQQTDPAGASQALRRQRDALQLAQRQRRPWSKPFSSARSQPRCRRMVCPSWTLYGHHVQFNFGDLPDDLIVSPRDRIELEASVYLRSDLELNRKAQIEDQVAGEFDRSTLVEQLGGLGVWPTLVYDRASPTWILSTIAHEWTHTYLAFFPLGWNYFSSSQMTTMNETVATIVGNEIGQTVAEQIYGVAPPQPQPGSGIEPLPKPDSNQFDFNTEMRRTRLRVDELLAAGQVDAAERYMEQRRQVFVAHGYPIRKLNQAYFAFHGSYATTAASSDPIGPKLQELRSLMPDLATFMQAVRGIGRPPILTSCSLSGAIRG